MRRAIIVGHTGQDGRILWDQLAAKGFSLIGISRHDVRTRDAEWSGKVDVADAAAVHRLVRDFRPDQIYYLAAFHHSSEQRSDGDAGMWEASLRVHTQGFLHVLNAATECHPAVRIFYASSSRIFGDAEVSPQSEMTPLRPKCIYGATKALGMALADYHRRNCSLFVSCGILFNHESPHRGSEFVSQRIVRGLLDLAEGRTSVLEVGSLSARVDWGYAPEYTEAMQLMLDANDPGDFVVASGETHSVKDMIEIVADLVGVRWRGRIVENASLLKRESQELCGDSSRLRQLTGWRPRTSFRDLVGILVRAARERETAR